MQQNLTRVQRERVRENPTMGYGEVRPEKIVKIFPKPTQDSFYTEEEIEVILEVSFDWFCCEPGGFKRYAAEKSTCISEPDPAWVDLFNEEAGTSFEGSFERFDGELGALRAELRLRNRGAA